MLLLTIALLSPPALADDTDGDGVDASTDCDDTDPEVWTTESSSTKGYRLDTDAEVEAFCDGYCSRAIGYLTLDDVSTTEGLSCVTKISKTLNVIAPELGSLSGLDGVTSIGTFILASSDLPDMRGLDSLSNLDKLWIGCEGGPDSEEEELLDELKYCASDVGVNDSLSSLRGMGTVSDLDELYIRGTALTNLDGLNRVTKIGDLVLYKMVDLSSLDGLDSLSTVTNLWLGSISGLSSLRGLGGLSTVSTLGINSLSNLRNLSGPASLTTIGTLNISSSDSLTNLRGLPSLSSLSYLYLSKLEGLISLRGMERISTVKTIDLNDLALLSTMQGLSGLTTATTIELNDLALLSTMQGLNGLTTVSTLKLIDTPNLHNLEGLEALTKVSSTLSIGCGTPTGESTPICVSAPYLRSLEPLSGLTTVGELSLTMLPGLDSLTGLEGLTSLTNLTLDDTGLRSLDALEGLSKLSNLYLGCHTSTLSKSTATYIDCDGNPYLREVDGLSGLTSLSSLRVVNNPVLENLDGLAGLTTFSNLEVAGNSALSRLPDLPTMSNVLLGCHLLWKEYSTGSGKLIQSEYTCPGQEALEEVPAMSLSTSGTFILSGTPLVSSLDGLSGTTQLGDLAIAETEALTDLSGLDALDKVTHLWVGCIPIVDDYSSWSRSVASCEGTTGLESLDGLEALRYAGTAMLAYNADLTDVSGLGGVTTVTDIYIGYNESLSTADAEALVDTIGDTATSATIEHNAP